MSLNIAAGLRLGGNESYPGVFQPFGGFADGVAVEDGHVRAARRAGHRLRGEGELYAVLRSVVKPAGRLTVGTGRGRPPLDFRELTDLVSLSPCLPCRDAVLAADLRADLAAREPRRVDVGVGVPGPHRGDQLGERARLDPLVIRPDHVGRVELALDRPGLGAGRRIGGGLGRLLHRKTETPPLTARFPKWMCACWTVPSRPE